MLLGLKGNLRMTLVSRLSTAAHLELLSYHRAQWNMSPASNTVIQAQAAVLALFAAMFIAAIIAAHTSITPSFLVVILTAAMIQILILLLIAIPGHLIFTFEIALVQAGHTPITPSFLVVYLTAAVIPIQILQFLARSLILFMWQRKIDPDSSAIPYLKVRLSVTCRARPWWPLRS